MKRNTQKIVSSYHGQICRFFGIELIKMYLIRSNVFNFKNCNKRSKSLHPTAYGGPLHAIVRCHVHQAIPEYDHNDLGHGKSVRKSVKSAHLVVNMLEPLVWQLHKDHPTSPYPLPPTSAKQ